LFCCAGCSPASEIVLGTLTRIIAASGTTTLLEFGLVCSLRITCASPVVLVRLVWISIPNTALQAPQSHPCTGRKG
jgi:hypothetical protein